MMKSNSTIKIKFFEDVPQIEISDSTYSFKKDEIAELPEYVAMFFVLKGSAGII